MLDVTLELASCHQALQQAGSPLASIICGVLRGRSYEIMTLGS